MSLALNLAQSLAGKKCSKVRTVRAACLLYFVTRPIKFVFYDIVFAVDSQCESSFNVTCSSLFRVFILPPLPYSSCVQKCAHATTKLAKRSKSPARLCIALLATLTTSLATNDSMQITRRQDPLCKRQIWRI